MASSSITDWIQAFTAIGGVAIGAVGLVVSLVTLRIVASTLKQQNLLLRQQARVNKAQFDLLEIESKRAAREIKPDVSVESIPFAGKQHLAMNTFVSFAVSSKKYEAKRVCVEYLSVPNNAPWVSDNLLTGKDFVLGDLPEGKSITITFQMMWHTPGTLIVRFHYMDVDGRSYYKDYVLDNATAKEYYGSPSMFRNTTPIFEPTPYPDGNKVSDRIQPQFIGRIAPH